MAELGLLIASLILVFALISLVNKKTSRLDRNFYQNKWSELEKNAKQTYSPYLIAEADKLLDKALKDLNIKGTTMAERMKTANKIFKENDAVWKAHKLRNKLVHETDIKLKKKDVIIAMSSYRRALRDLGAL